MNGLLGRMTCESDKSGFFLRDVMSGGNHISLVPVLSGVFRRWFSSIFTNSDIVLFYFNPWILSIYSFFVIHSLANIQVSKFLNLYPGNRLHGKYFFNIAKIEIFSLQAFFPRQVRHCELEMYLKIFSLLTGCKLSCLVSKRNYTMFHVMSHFLALVECNFNKHRRKNVTMKVLD